MRWLEGRGSCEPVEGGVVQQKSRNTRDKLTIQGGWSLHRSHDNHITCINISTSHNNQYTPVISQATTP